MANPNAAQTRKKISSKGIIPHGYNGSQAFNKAGSYGTGAYSFSTYTASGASSETIADTVGGITNRFERTTTWTTTGTGSTGTMTTVSQGAYTYGSSSPEAFVKTTTTSVALTGAALPVALPQERVLPLPPTMGNGGGGPVASGPAVMGTGDAILQGPWSGGLMLREFLGAANGWVVRIGGQMNGASLGLASDGGGGSQRPLVDWLKMAINGAPPGPMPLGYYIPIGMMSWQPQQTFSLWMAAGGSYMNAWAGYTAAHRIADPLGKEAAGRAFSAAIQGLSGSEVSLNWSRKGLEFVAGAADVLTAGLSTRLLRVTSLDQFLDLSSSSFQAGRYAGEAATIALTLWTPVGALQWIKTAHGSLGLLGGLVNGLEQWSNGNRAGAAFSISMGVVSLALSLTSCQWQGWADKALRNLGGTSSALKGGAALVGGSAAGTAVTWTTGLGASALKGVVSAGGSSAFLGKAAGWVSSGLMVYGAGAGVYETGRRLADGDVLGALLSAGLSMADMHAASRSCFTAEMLLDCDGGRKRADQIQLGDLLWSQPEGNPYAKAELKPVEEVFVRTSPVLTIRVAGQAIRTTAEHPFWVQSEGWLPAGFLRPGDLLRTRGGLLIAVEAVENNGEVETVYNWRIREYHTYYVSANEDGVSLWAHNATLYHYTSEEGIKGMNSSRKIKAGETGYTKHGVEGSVVWLTPHNPETVKAKGVTNYGLTKAKAKYAIEVEVPDESVKQIRGGRGEYVKYVTEDIPLPSKGKIGIPTGIE